MRTKPIEEPCPCGTGDTLSHCCGPLLIGVAQAPTAQALMRSRYTAYATGDDRYIFRTWHPRTRPTTVHLDPDTVWTALTIDEVIAGGPDDEEGVVAFAAHFHDSAGPQVLRERSRFTRRRDRWVYLDHDH